MIERRVVVRPERRTLAEDVAARLVGVLARRTQDDGWTHVSLTGGSMGIAVLEHVRLHPFRDQIDWARVHLWWSDERFVPAADPERNALQAREALIDHIDIPPANVHEAPAADGEHSLDDAAAGYAAELAAFGAPGHPTPSFSVCLLGVGGDGHIASLFPDRDEVAVTDATVLPVRSSPKPPPERVTFSMPVINTSERVWFVLAGDDKAAALSLMMAGAGAAHVPAAGASGTEETVVFTDSAAAADVPPDLIRSDG